MTKSGLKEVFRYLIDSGIKSVIEIQIITPDAKLHAEDIILSLFLILINIGITPIKVDKPANEVKINGYNILNHLVNDMLLWFVVMIKR